MSETAQVPAPAPAGHARSSSILPASLPPRGLARAQAAAYVGVSPSLFDQMVADQRMPGPKHVNARRIWDRLALDAAFAALPDAAEAAAGNPWDRDGEERAA